MSVLVTGANGQLGSAVCLELSKRGIPFVGMTRQDADLTDKRAVLVYLYRHKPTVIIHTAAYTNVEKAEEDVVRCRAVNVTGTQTISQFCREEQCVLLFISTDYVFSGEVAEPYAVDQVTKPLNVYGQSKADAEMIVRAEVMASFIVRTSWLFGHTGKNFVKTMLAIGKTHDVVRVVSDQVGSPTYAVDLARLLCDLIATKKYGTYHATNRGAVTWADFARTIFQLAARPCRVEAISTKEYGTKANRPKNSCLSDTALRAAAFEPLPTWQDALQRFLTIEQKAEPTD